MTENERGYLEILREDATWAANELNNYATYHPRAEAIIWGTASALALAEACQRLSQGYGDIFTIMGLSSSYFAGLSIHTLDNADKQKK